MKSTRSSDMAASFPRVSRAWTGREPRIHRLRCGVTRKPTTLQRPEFEQVDLDMEQVTVCIGDDEMLVSWHLIGRRRARVTARKAHAVTDSGEVIVVSRDGQCW